MRILPQKSTLNLSKDLSAILTSVFVYPLLNVKVTSGHSVICVIMFVLGMPISSVDELMPLFLHDA